MTMCARPSAASHRENPAARILVTGCYAQRAPEELAALPGVEWVVGNSHKTRDRRTCCRLPSQRAAPYHGQIHRWRHLRAPRFSHRAGDGRPRRPHPPQSQDPGRLQQSLLVLHHPVRARTQPQRTGRLRSSSRCAASPAVIARSCSAASTSAAGAGNRAARMRLAGSAAAPARRNRNRAPAPQLRRAHGFLRRPARPDGRIPAHREARARAAAIRLAIASCAACIASIARAITPTASSRPGGSMPDAAIGADVMVGFPRRN